MERTKEQTKVLEPNRFMCRNCGAEGVRGVPCYLCGGRVGMTSQLKEDREARVQRGAEYKVWLWTNS